MKELLNKSIWYTLITIFGSLIGIIFIFLVKFLQDDIENYQALTQNGEVILICMSLAINAIYIFYNYKKEIKETWATKFFWLTLIFFVISLLIYSINSLVPDSTFKIKIIFFFSIFILFFTIGSTFAAQYFFYFTIDIDDIRTTDTDKLEKKIRKIRGTN